MSDEDIEKGVGMDNLVSRPGTGKPGFNSRIQGDDDFDKFSADTPAHENADSIAFDVTHQIEDEKEEEMKSIQLDNYNQNQHMNPSRSSPDGIRQKSSIAPFYDPNADEEDDTGPKLVLPRIEHQNKGDFDELKINEGSSTNHYLKTTKLNNEGFGSRMPAEEDKQIQSNSSSSEPKYKNENGQSSDEEDDKDPDELIKLVNVHKTYLMGLEGVQALRGINLTIRKGEFVCILGTSGGGKTTLLNIIGTIDKPTKGDLYL